MYERVEEMDDRYNTLNDTRKAREFREQGWGGRMILPS